MGTAVSLQPPPQYDVAPPVPVIERILSFEELQKVCAPLLLKTAGRVIEPTEFFRGCTQPRVVKGGTTVCLVYRVDYEIVRRHEWAHCAGWPADHPGGR